MFAGVHPSLACGLSSPLTLRWHFTVYFPIDFLLHLLNRELANYCQGAKSCLFPVFPTATYPTPSFHGVSRALFLIVVAETITVHKLRIFTICLSTKILPGCSKQPQEVNAITINFLIIGFKKIDKTKLLRKTKWFLKDTEPTGKVKLKAKVIFKRWAYKQRFALGRDSLKMPSGSSDLVLVKRKGEASFCSLEHGR